MNCLLVLMLLLVAGQGLSTSLRNQVRSLVGKDLAKLGATTIKINEIDYEKLPAEDGRNILHYAARLGDLPLVEFLTANGVDTKLMDKDGLLPLDHAIDETKKNHSSQQMLVVAHILEKTYGVNGVDKKGWPAINWVILSGDLQSLEELIDRGSEVRVLLSRRAQTMDILKTLKDKKINALIVAKYKNVRNNIGRTLLHEASRRGNKELVKLLLEAGADPNTTDNHGRTPLHDAFRPHNEVNEELIKLLLEAGADPNTTDNFNVNASHPLASASVRGRTELAKLLIDAGADVNAIDSTYSILQLAVIYGRTGIVKILIDAGVDVNATSLGRTSLYIAVEKNRLKIAKLLIDAGADLNATNGPYEQTALHRAVFKERTEMIKLLIQAQDTANDYSI